MCNDGAKIIVAMMAVVTMVVATVTAILCEGVDDDGEDDSEDGYEMMMTMILLPVPSMMVGLMRMSPMRMTKSITMMVTKNENEEGDDVSR